MLQYIIDGFNVVHKISSLKRSVTPRADLIRYIKKHKLTGSQNNEVTVVFDGAPSQEVISERGVKVLYSDQRSADDLIIAQIKRTKNTSQLIVVSDDREIRDCAKTHRALSVRVLDFITPKKISKSQAKKQKDISYTLQKEITDEMRKIWLKE
jgi:predicted RNA-binding protein with PIN domain